MRPSLALRMYSARLTLFTKKDCGLCDVAKSRVNEVLKKRVVEYNEVDIEAKDQQKWKEAYAWDVPVLHVEKLHYTYAKPDITTKAQKLMHRFTTDEIEKLIDEAEQP